MLRDGAWAEVSSYERAASATFAVEARVALCENGPIVASPPSSRMASRASVLLEKSSMNGAKFSVMIVDAAPESTISGSATNTSRAFRLNAEQDSSVGQSWGQYRLMVRVRYALSGSQASLPEPGFVEAQLLSFPLRMVVVRQPMHIIAYVRPIPANRTLARNLLFDPDGKKVFPDVLFQESGPAACAYMEILANGRSVGRHFATDRLCQAIAASNYNADAALSAESMWHVGASRSRDARGAVVTSQALSCATVDELRIWQGIDASEGELYGGSFQSTARLSDSLHPAVLEAANSEEATRVVALPDILQASMRPMNARGARLNLAFARPSMFALPIRTPSRFIRPGTDATAWNRAVSHLGFGGAVGSAPSFGVEAVDTRVQMLAEDKEDQHYHRRPVGFCPGLLSVSERAQVEARFPPACRVGRFLDAYGAAMEAGYAAMSRILQQDAALSAFEGAAWSQL